MSEYPNTDHTDINKDSHLKFDGPICTDSLEETSQHKHSFCNKLEIVNNVEDKAHKIITVYGNDVRKKNPHRLGKVYSFLYIRGSPMITIGPQFYMSIILFVIVNGINILMIQFFYQFFPVLIKLIGVLIYIVQVCSQLYTTLINPGVPRLNNYLSSEIIQSISENILYNQNFNFDKFRVCKDCNILIEKEERVTHCDECQLCCEGFDHHCVWIGKCIGKRNLHSFKLFVSFTFIFFIFAMFGLMYAVIAFSSSIKHV